MRRPILRPYLVEVFLCVCHENSCVWIIHTWVWIFVAKNVSNIPMGLLYHNKSFVRPGNISCARRYRRCQHPLTTETTLRVRCDLCVALSFDAFGALRAYSRSRQKNKWGGGRIGFNILRHMQRNPFSRGKKTPYIIRSRSPEIELLPPAEECSANTASESLIVSVRVASLASTCPTANIVYFASSFDDVGLRVQTHIPYWHVFASLHTATPKFRSYSYEYFYMGHTFHMCTWNWNAVAYM